jgi:hypothetical protein
MMTDEEIQRIARETGTSEAVIRTALPLIPVDKHSEWIGLLKSDNAASKMAHSYGWTVQHAISYLGDASAARKRSRLRFSIRDLFWQTALIAMGIAWWLDRSHLEASRHRDRLSLFREIMERNQQGGPNLEDWQIDSVLKQLPPGMMPDD